MLTFFLRQLWVGSPTPQRQTVIVDTGSSITAFPCTGCDHCGSNPTTGQQYHSDLDFDVAASETYEERFCKKGTQDPATGEFVGREVCELGSCTLVDDGQGGREQRCSMAVSYAEGSSWSANEGSDIVYPGGPHDATLEGAEEKREAGVGRGMGSLTGEKGGEAFDWMDFRLRFGCQSKVRPSV